MFSKKVTVSKEELQEFRRVFDKFDMKQKREVPIKKLGHMMDIFNQNFTKSYIKDLSIALNYRKKGKFTYDDFLRIVVPKMILKQTRMELREVFNVLDRSGMGYICEEDLAYCMKALGVDNSSERVQDILKESDLDGDGKVTFEDFCKILTTK
ncbi:unnamed protein product [Brassicogethes aeneus]|uniref:EF-hand domain-containing protein n=1 Tax=Brassicogethes aeneus TaxID=1431903 RepID=A0A9P0B570_BRAAE|nr:unnamed protein product [Brassicogethes aeneus]